MNTENEFYKQKHLNELMILEQELELKHQLNTIIKSKDLMMNILSMPFKSSSEKEEQVRIEHSEVKSDGSNLFQNGFKLFRSIQEIVSLSKNIIQQIKS